MKEANLKGNYRLFQYPEMDGLLMRYLFEENQLTGVNITIPFKEAALHWVDRVSPLAQRIGAVNTIVFENGELVGYNTDYDGIKTSLNLLGDPKPALIFGSGGASKAVQSVLTDFDIPFQVVSRYTGFTYEGLDAEIASNYPWWINCTPIGSPLYLNDYLPLPYSVLSKEFAIFDLVYDPNPTFLLQRAVDAGAKAVGGKLMLTEQAKKAWTKFRAAYYKNL
jgi:shikimate dehydrogenase